MNKISILLPHKEQFSKDKSGSASILVKDFYKPSVFKNEIKVYGSTVPDAKVAIKKIYNNINI